MHDASGAGGLRARAASCATRCAGWSSSRSRRPSSSLGSGDADVIGYARDGDDAVGVLLRVRDGRVVGREHRFLENVEEEADDDDPERVPGALLRARRGRVRRAWCCRFAPAELATRSRELLPGQRLARAAAGHRGALARARRAERASPAREPPASSRSRPRSGPRIRSTRWAATSGLSVVPRSLVCVDISTNQGRDTVGSLVWFEGGPPEEERVPQVPDQGRWASRTTTPPSTRWSPAT